MSIHSRHTQARELVTSNRIVKFAKLRRLQLGLVAAVLSLVGAYYVGSSDAYVLCGKRVSSGGTIYFNTSKLGSYKSSFISAASQWNGKANVKIAFSDTSGIPVSIRTGPFFGGQITSNYAWCPNQLPSNGVVFNNATWYGTKNYWMGTPGSTLFKAVATHETGHAIGLAHSTGSAVMNIGYAPGNPRTPKWSSPQSDDINGLRALYGSSGSTPAPGGGSSGSCSTSSGDTSGTHPTISRSSPVSSTCVKHVQYILTDVATHRGDSLINPKSCKPTGCDGGYGSNTEAAVRRYKVSKGLANSSTIDSATWSALHGSCKYMQKYPKNGADCMGSLTSSGSSSGSGGSSGGSGGATVNCPTSYADTSGSHTYIGYGDKGTCVKHAQYILTHVARWRGSSSVDPRSCSSTASSCDGSFGPNTEKAVKAYKVSKGLANTGIIDGATWSALHGSCKYMQKYPKNGADCNGTISLINLFRLVLN